MRNAIVSLETVLLAILSTSTLLTSAKLRKRGIMSKESVTFSNQLAFGIDVFNETGIDTPIACLDLCLRDVRCQTLFYRSSDGFCQLNSVVPSPGSFKPADGVKYYETSNARCPNKDGYAYNRESALCYKIRTDIKAAWYDARKLCQVEGGDLVVLDTAAKLKHMAQTIEALSAISDDTGLLIGLTDQEVEGDWRWLNGKPFPPDSPLWREGEPNNNDGVQHFVRITNYPPVSLDDVDRNAAFNFICELTDY